MELRMRIGIFLLLIVAGVTASAQQRVEFQRQKFDRSRFERPDPSARPPTPTPTAPATATATPATIPAAEAPAAEPVGNLPPASSTPMPTEPPAASSGSSVFSYSNTASSTYSSSTYSSTPAASTNTAIFSANASLPSGPPPATYPADATPEERAAIDKPLVDLIPSKWFNDADEYPELLALQKKTGACILVYFKNPSVSNEKGLCSWFEKSITTDIDWRKAMKFFIKLEITMPGPSAVRDLCAQFKVTKTPAIFVVKPGSTMYSRIMVFEYPNGSRPQPIEVPLVLQNLKLRCTPAYQTLF